MFNYYIYNRYTICFTVICMTVIYTTVIYITVLCITVICTTVLCKAVSFVYLFSIRKLLKPTQTDWKRFPKCNTLLQVEWQFATLELTTQIAPTPSSTPLGG